MAGVCKLSITETIEELKNLLTEQKTASGFQKIQALYLFKICHVKTVKELAMTIGGQSNYSAAVAEKVPL
ncbi:hypothetical protein [Microcoleus vaginatus]|uniref:hypothetical protein n=1 Tax=Microcoleus vaginatus TaxID=119532 RepID=UPI00403F1962